MSQDTETIEIRKTSDTEYIIEIGYSENHWNKTRLLQTEPKTTKIFITRENDALRFKIEDTVKARQIAKALPLSSSDGIETESRFIDLSEVKTPKQRTALFVEIIKSIYGYNFHDVSHVNVEYMYSTKTTDDPNEGKGENVREKEAEIRSKLKSAAFSGSGLLSSRRYQELVNADFFICKVVWTVDHDSGCGERVAISAEFTEPEYGKGFRFAVLGKWDRDLDGDLRKTRKKLAPNDLKSMQDAIEQAAFDAFDYVTSESFGIAVKEGESA